MSTSTEPQQNPCAAEAMLGTVQEIMHGRGQKRRLYKGTIIDWRQGTSTVEKFEAPEDGSRPLAYPTFELKLRLEDSGKTKWIGPFKDGNNGYPSDMWLGWEETMNQRDPYYLMCRIRTTLFGYCASEPVDESQHSEAWDNAAFQAFEDVCDLLEEHFADDEQKDKYSLRF